MFVMIYTRFDLLHVVSLVSRYMANPKKEYWSSVKGILKYIKGTLNMELVYSKGSTKERVIMGYIDVDYAGDWTRGCL